MWWIQKNIIDKYDFKEDKFLAMIPTLEKKLKILVVFMT